MLQLKDQGIFAVGTLPQDRLRGCKLAMEKEMKNSGRGTIHQFTEKMVLLFVSGLIIVESSLFPISLVKVLFPMQSNVMVRRKRWCKFHTLPVFKYTIGSWGCRQSRHAAVVIWNKTEESEMVPSGQVKFVNHKYDI